MALPAKQMIRGFESLPGLQINNVTIAQLGEHTADNRKVDGSTPSSDTKFNRDVAQLVEHEIHILGVAGSFPVITTKQGDL